MRTADSNDVGGNVIAARAAQATAPTSNAKTIPAPIPAAIRSPSRRSPEAAALPPNVAATKGTTKNSRNTAGVDPEEIPTPVEPATACTRVEGTPWMRGMYKRSCGATNEPGQSIRTA